jgi:hypothetical protein
MAICTIVNSALRRFKLSVYRIARVYIAPGELSMPRRGVKGVDTVNESRMFVDLEMAATSSYWSRKAGAGSKKRLHHVTMGEKAFFLGLGEGVSKAEEAERSRGVADARRRLRRPEVLGLEVADPRRVSSMGTSVKPCWLATRSMRSRSHG